MRTYEEIRAYQLSYRIKNKDKLSEKKRIYTKKNRERIRKYKQEHKEEIRIYNREYNKLWYAKNKELRSENYKIWCLKNREKRNEYARKYRLRRINDIQFRLSKLLRTRIYHALKGKVKPGSAIKDIGCTVEELKSHIESKFSDGMSWDNWGYRGWHIDHIRPLASFDLSDREQMLESVHYTNLQPLWAEDNLKKGAGQKELLNNGSEGVAVSLAVSRHSLG